MPDERRSQLCLTDDEALTRLGKRLEAMHGAPQDVEFAIDEEPPPGSNLVLLQCRPETVWSSMRRTPAFDASKGIMSWVASSVAGTIPASPQDGGAVGRL